MSRRVLLALRRDLQTALWRHLLPPGRAPEQAAFVYTAQETQDGATVFRGVEWYAVPPDGFASRSSVHFELADDVRAKVIKRAHDLGASLVEFHSHTGPWPAAFSGSDLAGFREFVPHIWWRLKGQPYLAVVVARSGFDGFAWIAGPETPGALSGLLVDQDLLQPTGLSRWESDDDDNRPI